MDILSLLLLCKKWPGEQVLGVPYRCPALGRHQGHSYQKSLRSLPLLEEQWQLTDEFKQQWLRLPLKTTHPGRKRSSDEQGVGGDGKMDGEHVTDFWRALSSAADGDGWDNAGDVVGMPFSASH